MSKKTNILSFTKKTEGVSEVLTVSPEDTALVVFDLTGCHLTIYAERVHSDLVAYGGFVEADATAKGFSEAGDKVDACLVFNKVYGDKLFDGAESVLTAFLSCYVDDVIASRMVEG